MAAIAGQAITRLQALSGLTPARHQGVKSINALRRGMEVLQAIEDTSAATFAELHQQTGLPKASLLRILKTLRECGRISYSQAQRRYMPSTHGGSTDEARDHWQDRLISIAAPACQALQRRVPWPVDLAIRDGQAMLILDALRAPTGFAVNYRALGFRPPMLLSSLGRCYLAFCPAAEREDLLSVPGPTRVSSWFFSSLSIEIVLSSQRLVMARL